MKIVHKTEITSDKKLKAIIKKFGVQPLQGIDEVNMFTEDKTVMHFEKPEGLLRLFLFSSYGFYPEQHFRSNGKI